MVEIRDLNKKYEKFQIKDLNLSVKKGEFISILGQSGSGKSTLLNLISGSDNEYQGEILLDGHGIEESIKQGKVAMVFQDPLLLPHLNLWENIAFGLKIRRVPKEKIVMKVSEVIGRLELKGLEKRYPNQLSGGQRQRVSIGRALVMEPELLLMDEPFSALDAKLREKLQGLMKALQKDLKLTIIFVTHDRDEAFYLSDRIVLMHHGDILQEDGPEKMYNFPNSEYIAKFMGIENIFPGEIFEKLTGNSEYRDKTVAIPSENMRVSLESGNFKGVVKEKIFKTGFYILTIETSQGEIAVKQNRIDFEINTGDTVFVKFRPNGIITIQQ